MKQETVRLEAERTMELSEIEQGTFFYKIARANIRINGYYTCTLDGVKTFIS